MAGIRAERRLVAIVAADVAGYSRLMGTDEEGTLSQLKAHRRELIDPKIEEHRGRIVKTTGDGLLVEFASAVDAVRCAAEIQRSMAERDAALPKDRRIKFRIGINVGDVIIEDGDVFGDGVNIAARLEGIAEPGGICVSDDAYRQVQGKVDAFFIDLGEQRLKNIAKPMRVYRAISAGTTSDLEAVKPALAVPDKPSIAVLPFQNMSGDPEQEYFADGMVEEIITGLSRVKWLFVIARNSSFVYKGRTVEVRQVGRELGVRYLLEGSIRKAANRVRITGQLIDSTTAAHVWADRFEGDLNDVFELQDHVMSSVAAAIEPAMLRAEIVRSRNKPTTSLDAYDWYLRALFEFYAFSDCFRKSLSYCRQALAEDPRYSSVYGLAATCAAGRRVQGWMDRHNEEIQQGLEDARMAIEFGDEDPVALIWAGHAIGMLSGEHQRAIDVIERGLSLNPNSADGWWRLGWMQVHFEADKAIEHFERAMRLSPRDPHISFVHAGIGWAHFLAGRYDQSVRWANCSLHNQPRFLPALRVKTAACGYIGQLDEAKLAISNALQIDPTARVSKFVKFGTVMPQHNLELFLAGWRKAGLPE